MCVCVRVIDFSPFLPPKALCLVPRCKHQVHRVLAPMAGDRTSAWLLAGHLRRIFDLCRVLMPKQCVCVFGVCVRVSYRPQHRLFSS